MKGLAGARFQVFRNDASRTRGFTRDVLLFKLLRWECSLNQVSIAHTRLREYDAQEVA
jgi:hypothetical protein